VVVQPRKRRRHFVLMSLISNEIRAGTLHAADVVQVDGSKGAEMQRDSERWLGRSMQLLAVAILLVVPSLAQDSKTVDSSRPERLVVISVADRKLVVVDSASVIAKFSIAVGATASPSPTGEFRIINRVSNPTYYHPGTVIPSGKDNPLGTRWIGLSLKGYGIHGTNAPRSIGCAASHGCIRLRNRDIERLFALLHVGDRVEIHGNRDEQVARYFGSDSGQELVAEAQSATVQAEGGQ
jgi:lipoprotein-anchoring transpeptidase ErfK/SrfK